MALVNDAVTLAVPLARRSEGFRERPYLDCAGVPTIGYGFTRYADGRRVTLADPPIELDAAIPRLVSLMQQSVLRALQLCPGADTAGRVAALADFLYNLGETRLAGSTLRRCVNAGRWELVPAEFRKWRIAGGKIARGLVLRREAEIALLNQ